MAGRSTTQIRTTSLIDSASNTVVLAFDLADARIADMPGELSRSIQSAAVQDAIKKALFELALAKQRSGTTTITDREATSLASALGTGVAGAVGSDLIDHVRRTPEYQSLEQSLKTLEDSLRSSPLGVWIDRNAGVLYVVGAGIAIGGAAALFATKTGSSMVDLPISRLTGKAMQVYKLGTLSVAGQVLCFQPRTQTVGAALIATEQWERLQVGVQLGVVATGRDVGQVNGKLVFKTQDVSLSLTGTSRPMEKTVNLGLGIEVTNHGLPGRLSIEVALGMRDKQSDIGATGTWRVPSQTGTFPIPSRTGTHEIPGQNNAKLLAKWSLTF
jgi:hypothetical protein